jgi:hypothetical protein
VPVQAKLKIGQPGDKYEQEADRVAEQVMRMPDPRLQRQVEPEEEEEEMLQAKPLAPQIMPLVRRQIEPEEEEEEEPIQAKQVVSRQTPQAGPSLEAQIRPLRGGGRLLSQSVRDFFEPRFGHDFSRVRVHADAKAADSARAVSAQAYTVGHNVVFSAGQYAPGTRAGRRLLAHELAHVVQQTKLESMTAGSESLAEVKARRSGEAVADSRTTRVRLRVGGVAFHLQPKSDDVKISEREINLIFLRIYGAKRRAMSLFSIRPPPGKFYEWDIRVGELVGRSQKLERALIRRGTSLDKRTVEREIEGIEAMSKRIVEMGEPKEAWKLRREIEREFRIRILAGERQWTVEDLSDLKATLGRLDASEKAIVARFAFIREGKKPATEERCGQTTVETVRVGGITRFRVRSVRMWDECFGRPMTLRHGIRGTQRMQLGVPMGQARIQHEIGHTIDLFQNNPQIRQQFVNLIRLNRRLTRTHTIPANEPNEEAFAEAFAVFRTAPKLLRAVNPQLFRWFNRGWHIRTRARR